MSTTCLRSVSNCNAKMIPHEEAFFSIPSGSCHYTSSDDFVSVNAAPRNVLSAHCALQILRWGQGGAICHPLRSAGGGASLVHCEEAS